MVRDPHRYRLTRAGVLNVWQYDEHVFAFADGRLLLRGTDGAGKSILGQARMVIFTQVLKCWAGTSTRTSARRPRPWTAWRRRRRSGPAWS